MNCLHRLRLVVEAPLWIESDHQRGFVAHSTVEPCKGCHDLIDPIGHGFESSVSCSFPSSIMASPSTRRGNCGSVVYGGEFEDSGTSGEARQRTRGSRLLFLNGFATAGPRRSQSAQCLEGELRTNSVLPQRIFPDGLRIWDGVFTSSSGWMSPP